MSQRALSGEHRESPTSPHLSAPEGGEGLNGDQHIERISRRLGQQ